MSTESDRVREALGAQLRFEQLLSNVTAAFVASPADDVDARIEDALRRLVEHFGADRASFMQIPPESRELSVTHSWARPPFERATLGPVSPRLSRFAERLRNGERVLIRSVSDIPDHAAEEKTHMQAAGMRSYLAFPLQVGARIIGALSLACFTSECMWTEDVIPRLELLCQVFANALAHQRTAEELEASEEHLRLLVCAVETYAIDMLDAEGRVLSWNAGAERITGYSAEEIVGQHHSRFYPEEDSAAELPHQQLAMAQRRGRCEHEGWLVRKDGSRFWASSVITPILDSQGRLRGFARVTHDLTKKRRAEQMLRQAELEYRTVADFTYDWEYWARPDGSLRYLSPSCERVTGYSVPEILADPRLVGEIVAEEDREIWKEHRESAHPPTPSQEIRFRIRRKDGETRWIEHVCRPVVDAAGEFLGTRVSNRDVTVRQRAEQRLRESEDRYRSLFAAMAEGVVLQMADGGIVACNASAERILGLSHDQVMGRTSVDPRWNAVHEDGSPFPGDAHPAMVTLRTGEPCSGVVMGVRKPDGSLSWISINSQPVVDPELHRPSAVVVTFSDITERKRTDQVLRAALEEVARLKDRAEAENVYLKEEIRRSHGFDEIVGDSVSLTRILHQVEQVAATDSAVLLLGETGTGKELIARALHHRSRRRGRSLVTVACAALPGALIESELFGFEKGAFTGAIARTAGRFEVADGGSIFLDEVGDIPIELQVKLLRVLQEGTFERLGSSQTLKVDVRVIAATNRDLEQEVKEGHFRADLYYRLSVFPIRVPPLRERAEDIPLLVWHFITRKQGKLGKRIERVLDRHMKALQAYSWPGNIRELENVIERALIRSSGATLTIDEPFVSVRGEAARATANNLEEVERAHILKVLKDCGWKIAGTGNAAERLGLKRSTLHFRIKKLRIERPERG